MVNTLTNTLKQLIMKTITNSKPRRKRIAKAFDKTDYKRVSSTAIAKKHNPHCMDSILILHPVRQISL